MGSTVNPPDQSKLGSSFPFKFDLNLPPPVEEVEESQETDQTDQNYHEDSQSPVVNAGDGPGLQENGNKTSMKEKGNEGSLEVGPEEDEEENRRKRRFAALLEVSRIVSGDDGRSEPIDPSELLLMNYGTTGTRRQGNRSSAAAAEEEMAAAAAAEEQVGRRRSGRTQALPNRYRDSVMEPMTSLSSRHNRSSSKSSSKK